MADSSQEQTTPAKSEDVVKDLSRRVVLKGAAWAVPVITLTVAAPAAATSTTLPASSVNIVIHNFSPTASISYAVGGIAGNFGLQYAWAASGPAATVKAVVTVYGPGLSASGLKIFEGQQNLVPNQNWDGVAFSNTTPLTAGATYRVVLSGLVLTPGYADQLLSSREQDVTVSTW